MKNSPTRNVSREIKPEWQLFSYFAIFITEEIAFRIKDGFWVNSMEFSLATTYSGTSSLRDLQTKISSGLVILIW
jgi:hypothetical protein